MKDFVEYVFDELRRGRMSREAAMELLGPAKSAAELLVFQEQWQVQAPAHASPAQAIKHLACVCSDAVQAGALREAFKHIEPQLAVTCIAAGTDYAPAFASMQRPDALVYGAGLGSPVNEHSWKDLLACLQGMAAAKLACERVVLGAGYDDAVSRCHAESWIGLERSLKVLAPQLSVSVWLQDIAAGVAPDAAFLAKRMWSQLQTPAAHSVLYDQQQRYVLQVNSVKPQAGDTVLRRGGTYWITGGAGGLGWKFAQYLCREYGANVLLSGRSALDETITRRMQELQQCGGQVCYVPADVSDASSMSECVAQAYARFGALHGVLHAAGVHEGRTLFEKSADEFAGVLAPKVRGTLQLEAALAGRQVDFICYFSSSSAVLGDFGSGDYAMGNRFAMAYAQHAASAIKRIAINWPLWSGGMRTGETDSSALYLRSSGQHALPFERGITVFEQLLAQPSGHYLVLYGQAQRIRAFLERKSGPRIEQPRRAQLKGLSLEQCVLWELKEHLGELLKLDRARIEARENLAEYGADSMSLAKFARVIAAHYGIELTPAIFFSHPTLEALSAYLLSEHASLLEAFYRESVQPLSASPSPQERESKDIAAHVPAPATHDSPLATHAVSTSSLASDQLPVGQLASPIALIGMSGRFANARSIAEMWVQLVEEREAVAEIPIERFDWRELFARKQIASKWLGALPGVAEFDPLFFEISPREAQSMDPRQRLLLQEAWRALEDAGYGGEQLEQQKIGVYVGVEQGDYQLLAAGAGSITSNHDAILASRLSYCLNLRGPAMAINTSCSSGLVAVHQACLSLKAGECDTALAAAVNLMLTAHGYVGMSQAGMLSEDGRCYAFDRRANGMVPGEAVVAVLLKRLSRAEADGDPIHAVIRGSGINYDGKTNGITAPNGASQAQLLREVYERCGLNARQIGYIVTHGTGTRLGDPVEINALNQVFKSHTDEQGFCALTSTKTNLGHSFAASGLVSLICAVQAVSAGVIPASLHCEDRNEYIEWARSAFYVNRKTRKWAEQMRRAGVSAFGMSGTNAHVVLERYVPRHECASAPKVPCYLLVLSAKNAAALERRVQDLLEVLQPGEWDAGRLRALSYTLLCGRQHFTHRCAVVVADRDNAVHLLRQVGTQERQPNVLRGTAPREFDGQPVLVQYAQELLERIGGQGDDAHKYRQSLCALADLYCQGYTLAWRQLFGATLPQRLALPTYPFARERYWLHVDAANAAPANTQPASASADTASPSGALTFVPVWEPVLQPAFEVAAQGSAVLLIGGTAEQQAEIQAVHANARVLCLPAEEARASAAMRLPGADCFDQVIWIAAARPPVPFEEQARGARLEAQAREEGDRGRSDSGSRLAPQATSRCRTVQRSDIVERQEGGVLGCFNLIQALLRAGYGDRPLRFTAITTQCQPVQAHEAIDPTHAAVWGLLGAAAKEHPGWQVRVIDVAADSSSPLHAALRLPGDAHGNGWAHRQGQWYRQQYLPCELNVSPRSAFRQGGVYVLVGGAGALGMMLSEYLLRRYQAQVIWIGRRACEGDIAAAITRLGELGPKVFYAQADAADAAQLQAAHQQVRERYPHIHGVVHAAIEMSGAPLAQMSAERFRAGLAAKVQVSVRLAEVFATAPLDFMLFFSSIQSFEKTARQSNYAAGCTFADAFAHYLRREAGYPVKVMNWGYWRTAATQSLSSLQHWLEQAGMDCIEADEGLAVLERSLASPLPQVAYAKTLRAAALQGVELQPQQIGVAGQHSAVRCAVSLEDSAAVTALAVSDELGECLAQLDASAVQVLGGVLHSMGLAAERGTAEQLIRQLGITPQYARWFEHSLRMLRERGAMDETAEIWRAAPGSLCSLDEAWNQWERLRAQWCRHPDLQAQVRLLEATLRSLRTIVQGGVAATDVMFPRSSMELVQDIYSNTGFADHCNEVLAEVLANYVRTRVQAEPDSKLRILEIGAGTGGTSQMVFRKLMPLAAHLKEYCYTDISKAFLLHALEHYAASTPYLRQQLFNVEDPPAAQGIGIGTYDAVIATNVLHATRNVRHALRNAKAVLKMGGVLLLNEFTGSSVFSHLTFGLLEGWWRFEDEALRVPGGPALSPQGWLHALTVEGYEAIGFPASSLHAAGAQIIVAHSDGVIRQPGRMEPVQQEAAPELEPVAAPPAANGVDVTPSMLESQVRQVLLEHLSESLMMDLEAVEASVSFAELGLDSLLSVRAVEAINRSLPVKLTSTTLFDYSSVDKLTRHIVAEYRDALSAQWRKADESAAPPRATRPSTAQAQPQPAKPQVKMPAAQADRIAVIGMSARYPKSPNVDALWERLRAGEDLTEEVTRWDLSQYFGPQQAGQYCKRGGFIEGIDQFDPLFFNISGIEATYMDPQQRLFLQHGWSALESAGYVGAGMAGKRCGVYAGYNGGDYATLLGTQTPPQAMWGTSISMIAARIAYCLDLQGPAITLDTACSSSLVAVHLACQALRSGEIDLGLAGGVFVQCTPMLYLTSQRAGMLSVSGRCHTFDERADGFVPCEGVGVVVLKRLGEALADGDSIEAVIAGSGINQDGATNGITAPSALSQERLERDVYERFGIDADTLQMVEAHGTATKLGDPIEYQALTRAFRKDTARQGYCALGSIKTNMGHATAAAGVAGLIKAVLALRHRQIPASLNFAAGNSHIDFTGSPFYVPTELQAWDVPAGTPRRAAVSSFGMSGTNAHIVVEEAPSRERSTQPRPGYLIVLSARTTEQLREQATQLLAHAQSTALDCGNLSYTLLMGRRHFAHRLSCIARDPQQCMEQLQKWLQKGKAPQVQVSRAAALPSDAQVGLKRYAQQCMHECSTELAASEYLQRLATIAELYVQGYDLDFAPLFASQAYARIRLPTYPFAKERYWVETSHAPAVPVDSSQPEAPQEPVADAITVLLAPQWQPIAASAVPATSSSGTLQHHVLLCGIETAGSTYIYESFQAALAAECPEAKSRHWLSEAPDAAARSEAYGLKLLAHVQDILRSKPRGRVLMQVLVNGSDVALLRGLGALLKTARIENPHLQGQVLGIETAGDAASWVRTLLQNIDERQVEIRYQQGIRHALTLNAIEHAADAAQPWKAAGVYLITGGMGGLGAIFAQAIARNVAVAKLVLVGSSECDAAREKQLQALHALGAEAEYRQVDVAERSAVDALLAHIQQRYGKLDGVLHAAGVIRDSFLIKKTPEEFRAVLAPKIRGAVNLDAAIGERSLDCFVLCSSGVGFSGNAGQADYALANAFLDAFAEHRDSLVRQGKRHGRTVSVGWPLWARGGMQMPEVQREQLRALGLAELGTEQGIEALNLAYGSGYSQVQVLRALTAASHAAPVLQPAQPVEKSSIDAARVREKTLYRMRLLLSEVTRLNVSRIDAGEPLETYGLDSLMVLDLNSKLAQVFGELSKTLFYEYATLKELADYLLDEHFGSCVLWCGAATHPSSPPPSPQGRGSQGSAKHLLVPTIHSASPLLPWGEGEGRRASAGIAIIGLAGRYAQAPDLHAFWQNLKSGKDCVTEIPAERWPLENFYVADEDQAHALGKSYSKWGGFLEGFAEFDPLFFSITPREALNIDPQERLFLQCCWHVLEDAGYTRALLASRHRRRVGVFAGITKTGFDLYGPELWRRGEPQVPQTSFGSLANRVSYALDLRGPSMPIDTMCSASLTALHEACEHLARGECELAIAGGVNLYLHPLSYSIMCAERMLAPDGRCKSFGAGGNGFVPGEGVGAVLLKPLAQAEAHADHIYGVILATSVNHGGKTHGYTVPNPGAQAELIRTALDKAGVNARAVSYIEAHGTGTELGDPIEITGLALAFKPDTADKQFCAIGSVKTNIGHCESAAGIAGLSKILLQLQHRQLAPSLHAGELNPHIDFASTPFVVQRELCEWRRPQLAIDGELREWPLIAAVSSFGAGGANAHAIVQEYVAAAGDGDAQVAPEHPTIIVLSAKTAAQLRAQAQQLLDVFDRNAFTDADLPRIACTLQTGREAMACRLGLIVSCIDDLKDKLRRHLAGEAGIEDLHCGAGNAHKAALALLRADEDVGDLLQTWIAKGKHGRLVELWVNAVDVDWAALYGARLPRRIALPGYPFAKERYWIPSSVWTQLGDTQAGTQQPAITHAELQSAPMESLLFPRRNCTRTLNSTATARGLWREARARSQSGSDPFFSGSHLKPRAASLFIESTQVQPPETLAALCAERLQAILAQATSIEPARLDLDTSFEAFGLNSINLTSINREMQQWLGERDATLFFRYSSIRALSEHLIARFPLKIAALDPSPALRAASPQGRGEAIPPLSEGEGWGEGARVSASASLPLPLEADSGEEPRAIAIIGIAGRYPEARSLHEFWQNIRSGRDCISEIPQERWPLEGFFEPDRDTAVAQGKSYCKWGGFISGVDKFDAQFFGVAPRHAMFMDPEERLFVETAWQCLEDAGYARQSLQASGHDDVGIFVGASWTGYSLITAQTTLAAGHEQFATNNTLFSIANRVSYLMDFTGPSLTVDTACSSSLYAVHLACESIRSGSARMAIAGGVNLSLHPSKYLLLAHSQMCATDGRCRAFSEGGSGYVPAEAVGAVLLKSLAAARADGDHILAVIKSSVVNHGGKTNGYTVPNPAAQARLIESALRRGSIDPRTITCIEAHGTGTALGDPIEISGLEEAFRKFTAAEHFCAVSSVKSNIGHAEAAAGIAQLTKVVLEMKHRVLAPNVMHGGKLNANIDLAHSPFFVQTEAGEWRQPVIDGVSHPRRAGISSFGVGGANTHLIVEEPPAEPVASAPSDEPVFIVLSAREASRLDAQIENLVAALEAERFSDADLGNIAYTLQVGREPMEHRLALAVRSLAELQEKLQRCVDKAPIDDVYRGVADSHRAATLTASLEQHREVLSAWVAGANVDWSALHAHATRRRVSLPAYPFAGPSYWLPWVKPGAEIAELPVFTAPRPAPVALAKPALSRKPSGISLAQAAEVRAPQAEPKAAPALQPAMAPAAPVQIAASKPAAATSISKEVVEAELTRTLAEALYIDPGEVDAEKAFVAMGLDSIIAVEWVRAINQRFSLELPTARIYDYPDILALSQHVLSELAGEALPAAPMAEPVNAGKAATPAAKVSNKPSGISLGAMDAGLRQSIEETAPRPREMAAPLPAAVTSAPAPKAIASVAIETVERDLAASLADALYMDLAQIDFEKPFVDLGLDSIIAVEWMRSINVQFGLSLPTAKIYDHPDIQALAQFVAGELAASREAVTEMAPPPVAPVRALPARPVQPEQLKQPASVVPARTALEGIAVVGMSAQYPGAADLEAFWQNLATGRDCIREIPATRWDANACYDPRPNQPGKINCKWLGMLDEVECFDSLFFGISPAEAELMDPQQRLFLQEAYRTFESAGYNPRSLGNSKCGVYLGLMSNDYSTLLQYCGATGDSTGNSAAIAAARISYILNLKGPALSIDTACSSSLVAAHLACQALRNAEIDMALVGGVTLYLTPGPYFGMCAAGMLSADGRCKTLDNGADGFVPGEGVGALLLKRLSDAERDADRISGVIIASGINQDGKTNGITAPSAASQSALQRDVYERHGIDPDSISYVEMHGTGTKLGDPIELEALSAVFKQRTARRHFCALGSVKSNIGHTSAAAGVASLHKVLLALEHRQLVPTLHFVTPNENFNLQTSPFYVNTACKPWPATAGTKRRAAVSSFGYSGTNAHVVIEEYPEVAATSSGLAGGPALIVLSAKSAEQLETYIHKLHACVAARESLDLPSLAYTLQVGREPMEYRLGFTAGSIEQFKQKLSALASGASAIQECYRGEARRNKQAMTEFAGDEELQEAIAKWIERGKYAKLLSLWVKGLAFDWHRLYGASPPRRMALPTYPFAKERHWVAQPQGAVAAQPIVPAAAASAAERVECFLGKQWRAQAAMRGSASCQQLLIVANSATSALAVQLAAHFARAQVLNIDDAASEAGETSWEQYDGWIDVTGCGDRCDHDLKWLHCLQQWAQRRLKAGGMALCVTRALESWRNAEINLAGALRPGLYRMLQNEYAELRSRHMDVESGADDSAVVEQIVAEFFADAEDAEVCYRQGERHCVCLEPLQVPMLSSAKPRLELPQHGVLMVTGGTRGVGYLCAQHFVRQYGIRRVVLTGREAMPEREQWARLAEEPTALGEKLRGLQALEALGAQVQVSTVNLADVSAVRAEVAEITRSMGPVIGLIHSAGLGDWDTLALVRKTIAGMSAVLEPKVAGLDALLDGLAAQPLKFTLLFSSVSSLIPSLGVGQCDYTMANAYMDYVAEHHAKRGMPILSIQWPSWKETGFGEARSKAYVDTAMLTHTNREGLDFLDRLLANGSSGTIIPAWVDPARWHPARLMERKSDVRRAAAQHLASSENSGSRLAPRASSHTLQWLRALFAEHLKIAADRIELDTPLPDYGVDSVILAQLLRPISARVGTALDPSILYEYPTLEAFANWLGEKYGAALQVPETQGATPGSVVLSPATHDLSLATHVPAPLAVVGLSCRFAGANNLDEYWRLLARGESAIRKVPSQRWGAGSSGYYAGLLDDITHFDPAFFHIGEADARAMDPQALLLLEEGLKAWHHAGYAPAQIKGTNVGVYLGARSQHHPDEQSLAQAPNPLLVSQNYLAANLSRYFDVRGPSLVVDTACSSGLVAMNMAIQALRGGEISAAMVGAVSVLHTDAALRMFEHRGILQQDGQFHIFDQRARGSIVGEGAGMVVLKTLAQAQADGDSIYAVIKSIAINNDGCTAGIAAPSLQSLKAVMQMALDRSGRRAEEVSFVAVNGSGSEVTDLLELKAIEAVYRSESREPCELGSMKPNIGHPLCAEGMASFIKVVLMLHHRQRVPFLSAQQPLKHYDFDASPLRFNRTLSGWQAQNDAPCIAAVNCFADGGTNANLILESYRHEESRGHRQPLAPPELRKINLAARRAAPSVSRDRSAADAKVAPVRNAFWKRLPASVRPLEGETVE